MSEGGRAGRHDLGAALRALIGLLLGRLRARSLGALALTVGLSLTEGASLLLLVPLMRIAGLDVEQGAIGGIAGAVETAFAAVGLRPTLAAVLVLYVAISTAQSGLGRLQSALNVSFLHELTISLRHGLYRAISEANWLFVSRNRASDFVHVLTEEVDRAGSAAMCLLSIAANGAILAVYVALALRLSPALTAVALGGGSLLLLLSRRGNRSSRETGEELSVAAGDLYGAIIEHMGAVKTVKSYGAHERSVGLFSRLTRRVADLHAETARVHAATDFWFAVGSVLLLSAVLYVSLELLAVPVATVLLLLFLFNRITPRFGTLRRLVQQLVHLLPGFATVVRLRERCEAAAEPAPARAEPVSLERELRLERVSFGYVEGVPVLRDVDLTVQAGRTTAIVGPSGAGKSTVADVMMGLVAPAEGRVLVDGRPLGPEHMRSWRSQIGYVPQDTFLFHDTVRANLLWVRPEATEEEIWSALRAAAADFVEQLPDGLETVLGDRGVRLSGGERQRLALARALLRRPSLLVLDEATSALDSENERRIQRAIEELHGRATIVVITHRLSTIRGADTIYVLQDGRVVERGAWDALVADEAGRFSALCRAQNI